MSQVAGFPQYKKKTKDRVYLEQNVYEKALERIRHIFDLFDDISVSFSGGKDSTVVLNLALLVARERNRLPLKAFFWDEEAVAPPTIEYVERIMQNPDIALRWLCVPVLHRNGCSAQEPTWRPWEPSKRALWVREMPSWAETDLPGFTGGTIPESAPLLNDYKSGAACHLTGIRADESLRRYYSIMRKTADNYLVITDDGYAHAKPIYDWSTADVWLAPYLFGWDYNRTYDYYDLLGIARHFQRVAPPYGEEPMQLLYMYKHCFPELWDRMAYRVAGAATAARYSRTELYSFKKQKPVSGLSYQASIEVYLRRYPPEVAAAVAARIQAYIRVHREKSLDLIPEEKPHPITGVCWRRLMQVALRGDAKKRKRPVFPLKTGNVAESIALVEAGVPRTMKDAKRQRSVLGTNITPEMALQGISEAKLRAGTVSANLLPATEAASMTDWDDEEDIEDDGEEMGRY